MTVFSRLTFHAACSAHRQNMMMFYQQTHKQRRKAMRKGTRLGCPTRRRRRTTLSAIYRQLGPTYFRRAYRMNYNCFKELLVLISPYLDHVINQDRDRVKRAPNGVISKACRLAAAIRFFAGGDPYDIMQIFQISHSEVFRSVDAIISAVNLSRELAIMFPDSHDEQQQIARDFAQVSSAGFRGCCGCLDGLLIWTHKPTKEDCLFLGVGEQKFYCHRKGKYGLNLQAICDSKLRFLDLSILFGGSTSDLLAFETSSLKHKLETPGFLAPGLYLFGDNAYINRNYFATPFPNIHQANERDETKDAYNYFHSNVRIRIECAFGVLLSRWGFLRKKAPQQYTMQKTISTVSALCRLHNFLIDHKQDHNIMPTNEDRLYLMLHGAAPLDAARGQHNHVYAPQLADAGHHQDDHDRRRTAREEAEGMRELPRERLLRHVRESHLHRPEN